ncbi:hypothetical protein [Mesorhizobium sp. INR15]|uniref:hypothetical protein n=1 Tax=Mesorhizobium sp. INR15 TaxID=2654248 RepID=UPI0018C102C8|nr:hypothetical protein [Mesorhizobium sp. INR15]QPC93393.1 hypothetical protein GA829_24045 [Mesorhizobium sp. INR15]
MQHSHASYVLLIFLAAFHFRDETLGAGRPYASTLAHGRFFLATPGEFPDCMKVQSGFLFGLPSQLAR